MKQYANASCPIRIWENEATKQHPASMVPQHRDNIPVDYKTETWKDDTDEALLTRRSPFLDLMRELTKTSNLEFVIVRNP